MKVLFITYYWPPAGGVSVQRILHFVLELDNLGVECHVIHPENPSYYSEDTSLNKLIKSSIHCHPVKIFDVTKIIKLLPGQNKEGNIKSNKQGALSSITKKIRANWFIPDPKVGWVPKIVDQTIHLHHKEKYDLVFTNGTPHSVHLAGLKIKENINLPWIADFRDPWTKMDYFDLLPLNEKSKEKHQRLEHEVISNADITLTVSNSWKKDFKEAGAKRSECITNGFDEYIENIPTDDFFISHVGSIHSDRSLDIVINAIKELNQKNKKVASRIKLALIGNIDSNLEKKLQDKLPKEQVITTGMLNHNDAKSWIGKSKLLLLPINRSKASKGRVPAKLFEYLSARKPIALLGNSKGDAAKIILKNGFGKSFEDSQVEELEKYIIAIDNQTNEGHYNKGDVGLYSRQNLAEELLQLMKSLI